LAPHSPATDQIETLLWIGFIAAVIIGAAVNVALLFALRRYRATRAEEPRQATGGRRVQFQVAGALTAFAALLLVLGIVFTNEARETPQTGADGLQAANRTPLEIEATGQQWIWRYDYPNKAFSHYKLVVPVDTAIALDLSSTDVVHTWDVPSLAGKRDAVPGKTSRVEFIADEEGTYEGKSATLSGQGYASMRTAVEVVSPEEYEAYVKGLKADIQSAEDQVASRLQGGDEP
jgi:cytochrome c oxidase subunit 2